MFTQFLLASCLLSYPIAKDHITEIERLISQSSCFTSLMEHEEVFKNLESHINDDYVPIEIRDELGHRYYTALKSCLLAFQSTKEAEQRSCDLMDENAKKELEGEKLSRYLDIAAYRNVKNSETRVKIALMLIKCDDYLELNHD